MSLCRRKACMYISEPAGMATLQNLSPDLFLTHLRSKAHSATLRPISTCLASCTSIRRPTDQKKMISLPANHQLQPIVFVRDANCLFHCPPYSRTSPARQICRRENVALNAPSITRRSGDVSVPTAVNPTMVSMMVSIAMISMKLATLSD